MDKKLKKSKSDRMISGVCGGLANYMNLDTAFIRIGFLVGLFFFGTGIVLYIIFMIAIPTPD
jgi:phage shock protein C